MITFVNNKVFKQMFTRRQVMQEMFCFIGNYIVVMDTDNFISWKLEKVMSLVSCQN